MVIKLAPWTGFICGIVTLVAGVVIVTLAPVEDRNKPLDQVEKVIYRKRMCIVLGVLVGIELVCLAYWWIIRRGRHSHVSRGGCGYGVNDRLMPFYSPVMIRNNVIENGKRDTLLAFSHNGTTSNYIINGKWSPDSVPESGSVTI